METMQIDKICRACLREDDTMIEVSEKDVYHKFLLFANLTAKEIPDIPLNLCQSCGEKLNISLDFREECQKSHEILLNYVKNNRLAATDADATSQLEQFSQYRVLEAIEDLRQNFDKNTNCIRCNYYGKHSRALAQHVSKMHKDLKPRWCYVCNAEFDNLTDHVATNHSDDYTCKFCSKKFQKLTYLTDHLRSHSNVKPFRCSFCEKYFIRRSLLKVHLRTHTKEKPFKCGSCNKSFTRLYWLKQHLKKHESEGEADKQLAALALKKHDDGLAGKASHKCKFCGKEFNTSTHLANHARTHTGERPYVCQVCERSFAQTSTLQTHMKVHNIGTMISCHVCDKKFSRHYQLRVHLRRHTGDKPFVCTECGKGFIQRNDLVKHNKIHSDLRPYQCNNCDKSFRGKSSLKLHMLMHSGEKPFKCNQCSYASRHSSSLSNHMKQHEVDKPQADRPHVCLMCSRTFTTDAMLTSHINTHNVRFLEI